MVIKPNEKVKTSYVIPKNWKKKSNSQLVEEYTKYTLKEELEMRKIDSRMSYSRLQKLEMKFKRIQAEQKLILELLLKHLDDTTSEKTSFNRWLKKRDKK